MAQRSALIVDDEPAIRELLEVTLTRMGIAVTTVGDLGSARTRLQDAAWDLCLTDMRLPDGDGIDLVREIQRRGQATPVAVITAYGSMDSAIAALKAGAFDFLNKPLDLSHLRQLVEQALRLDRAAPSSHSDQQDGLLGESAAIEHLRQQIAKVARSQAPVVLTGESGTGKERAARLIHDQGPRADRPFVPVNCGAIPRELMESEFFGHARGAFTGAVSEKQGLFTSADGGTLFLDEIAELPLDMQVKLLRVLQEKRLRPVGATKEIEVDARILCASHTDLAGAVNQGRFREDLYYRINVIALHTPPLRERPDDVPVLTHAILKRLAASYGRATPQLSASATQALQCYSFPGNVRELENILERALALADGPTVQREDLNLPERSAAAAPTVAEQAEATAGAAAAANSLTEMIDEQQRQVIVDTLERTRWNRTVAARELGLTYRQLRYRLKKLGID